MPEYRIFEYFCITKRLAMEWLGLTIYAWITIMVMIGKFSLSAWSKIPGDVISLMAIAVLIVTGTLPTHLALNCFADPTVWLVILLLVLVTGLVQSGVIDWIVKNLMKEQPTYSRALNRLIFPVAVLSAFLNNETVVAVFLRVVKSWSKRLKIAPSKFLIPLSYSAGLGGVCTLIGTPPNLLVSTLYQEETGRSMNLFTPFLPGLCCLIAGFIFINLVKNRLLPSRKSPEEAFENAEDYTVELLVPTDNDAVGKTVDEAKYYDVSGGHLIEIVRYDKEVISPVSKEEFIIGGDRLVYTGNIKSLLEFRDQNNLVNATRHVFSTSDLDQKRQFQVASIIPNSSLIGHRMADLSFEDDNKVVLVAVARDGERIQKLPREITLRSRDILLFEGKKMNQEIHRHKLLFLDSTALPVSSLHTLTATLIMVGMILLSSFGFMPILDSCIIACFFMVGLRCCSVRQAQKSFNWQLLCTYAGSVCLGTAITETGLAQVMANGLLNVTSNPLFALSAICLIVTFMTEFISNVGAAAVFAPVGYNIAVSLGVNPLTFMVAIMISASSSFATPGSCDTHELICGPGGYKYTDFLRIGVPMNFIILIITILSTVFFYPLS